MPDAGRQPVRNAMEEAEEDRADRQIAEMVRRGLLFAVSDPETGEASYGATPAGLAWFNSHGGWPEPPAAESPVATQKRPSRSPAHAAPRRRSRGRGILAGLAAAITLPSITLTGHALGSRGTDTTPGTVEPRSDKDVQVPDPSNASDAMHEGNPRRVPKSPSPTASAPKATSKEASETKGQPKTKEPGRHRGDAATESLGELFSRVPESLKQGKAVRITIPGAGSIQPLNVQVNNQQMGTGACHGWDQSGDAGHHGNGWRYGSGFSQN